MAFKITSLPTQTQPQIQQPQMSAGSFKITSLPKEEIKESRGISDYIIPSTKALGETVGSVLAANKNRKDFEESVRSYTGTLNTLNARIREMESAGEDVTRLKTVREQALQNFPKPEQFGIDPTDKSALQVIGEVAGTALEASGGKALLKLAGMGLAKVGARVGLKALPRVLEREIIPSAVTTAKGGLLSKAQQVYEKTKQFFAPRLKTEAERIAYKSLPFKGKVGEIAKETGKLALEGGAYGYGFDVAQKLQEGKTGAEAFVPSLGTAIGVGIPAATGVIRTGILPLQSVSKTIRSFGKPTEEMIAIEKKGLQEAYEDVFKQREHTTRKEQFLKDQGKDPAKVLSEHGLIPDLDSVHGKTIMRTKGVGSAAEEATDRIAKRSEQIQGTLDKLSEGVPTLQTPLETFKQKVIQEIRESISGSELTSVERKLDDIFEGYKIKYGENLNPASINKIRMETNQITKAWIRPQFELDAFAVVGNVARKEIDVMVQDPIIRQLNKEIGELYAARKMLYELDGKGIGAGRFTNIISSWIGALFGQAIAGGAGPATQVVSSVLTTIGVKAILKLIQRGAFGGETKRRILQHLAENTELLDTLIAKEPKIIQDAFRKEIEKEFRGLPKRLPAGKPILPKAQVFVPPSIVPPTTFEKGYPRSQSSAIIKQTTNERTNIIPKSIPQSTTKGKRDILPKAKNLTTKFLEYAKGKTTLSKQEIEQFARRSELKKGEADLLNTKAQEIVGNKIPAQEFTDSIRRDLLELKPVKIKPNYYRSYGEHGYPDTPVSYPFENIRIKEGNPKNYEEVVFESPITTNGSSHYPNSKNYFAHARGDEVVENGKKIWREQEIQSDLLQKDNFESITSIKDINPEINPNMFARAKEVKEKLTPFTNDRFGERIMRERIKEKAQKGYSKYRIPTGETIGKIEGFEEGNWITQTGEKALPENVSIGDTILMGGNDPYLITKILPNGQIKAINEVNFLQAVYAVRPDDFVKPIRGSDDWATLQTSKRDVEQFSETFDLTGKSNPQYRRYQNWGKFLKNKFEGKEVIDPQGNSWIEIDLKKEMGKMPIEAFGLLPILPFIKQGEND